MTATIEAPPREQIDQRTELQKQVDAEVLEAVQRGVKFLNEQYDGTSWVDMIDMDSLNLMNGQFCVLGQLYGDEALNSGVPFDSGYAWACRNLPVEDDYGFYANFGDRHSGSAWDKLTDAWRYALTPFVKETA